MDALLQAHDAFWEAATSEQGEARVKDLVYRFGSEGAQADFRLLFGPAFTMRLNAVEWMTLPPGLIENAYGISPEAHRMIRDVVARHQVHVFLERPDLLDRYVQALLWVKVIDPRSRLSVDTLAENTAAAFSGESGAPYWWAARNVLILAEVTGREDLLKGAGDESRNLNQRFRRWKKWWDTERRYHWFNHYILRWEKRGVGTDRRANLLWDQLWKRRRETNWHLSVPGDPFPEWQGPPAPDVQLVSISYDRFLARALAQRKHRYTGKGGGDRP
jgi:hypothetical protein